MSYFVKHPTPRQWSPRQYVALGPDLRVVAFGDSRERAKERAIILGFHTPLILPASRILTSV